MLECLGLACVFLATASIVQASSETATGPTTSGFSHTRSVAGPVSDSSSFYATFLGGSSGSWAFALAVAPGGDVVLAGVTGSSDFPTTAGAYDRSLDGSNDAFVARLDPAGRSLVYSTFLGGGGADRIWSVALDKEGSVYVTGDTTSTDFPTTPNAYRGAFGGGVSDAFVAKLSPDGATLVYSTFLGGEAADLGTAITADATGTAFVAGATYSAGFPTANATRTTLGGTEDAFVAKFDPEGGISFSTYLGGSGEEFGGGSLVLDATGNLYLSGGTTSTDFPVTLDAVDATLSGGSDAFIARLDPVDGSVRYATYLGGSGVDGSDSLAVDPSGKVVVAGVTGSRDFPVTDGAFQTTFGGGTTDAFVAALRPDGTFGFGTYLGGGSDEFNVFVGTDSDGAIAVTTDTWSTDFPLTPDALNLSGKLDDVTLSILSPDAGTLRFSTYLGGSHTEYPHAIGIGAGTIAIAGETSSPDFPVTADAWNTSFLGDPQLPKAFFARFFSADVENTPPIADAGPDHLAAGGVPTFLNGSSSSDPDGDKLTFEWVQLRGPTVPVANATGAVAEIVPSAPGEYGFKLTVRDPRGGTGFDEVIVTVGASAANAFVRPVIWALIGIVVAAALLCAVFSNYRRHRYHPDGRER